LEVVPKVAEVALKLVEVVPTVLVRCAEGACTLSRRCLYVVPKVLVRCVPT